MGNSAAPSFGVVIGLDRQFLGIKPFAVVGLDRQFPWPQALSLSLAMAGDSLVPSLGAVIGLDGQFLGIKPLAVIGLNGKFLNLKPHCCLQPWWAITWPQALSCLQP
jgi:hypothetical protein